MGRMNASAIARSDVADLLLDIRQLLLVADTHPDALPYAAGFLKGYALRLLIRLGEGHPLHGDTEHNDVQEAVRAARRMRMSMKAEP
jgi:hypothetical protein